MKTTWIFILFLASLPFSCIAQDYTVNRMLIRTTIIVEASLFM
jgi:hypothetical protein